MKLLAAGVVSLVVAATWFVIPEIKLHAAMRGAESPNPSQPTIVMLGDSHTTFVNWRMLMGCESIANFGVGGNTSAQMLGRLPQVVAANPRAVLVMVGTNDALQRIDPALTVANMREIESELTAHDITTVFLAPPPLPSRRAEIDAISDPKAIDLRITESDLLADQIHLKRSAYAKWRDAIAPIVRKFCL